MRPHAPTLHKTPPNTFLGVLCITLAILITSPQALVLPQTSFQWYMLCIEPDNVNCISWLINPEKLETIRTALVNRKDGRYNCGISNLQVVEFSEDNPVKVKKVCRHVNVITKLDFIWRALDNQIDKKRFRRQAYPHRGRYRGQTQSQYLSIDRAGNEKDDGKAEAHSDADSSRAIVIGSSGMGQAQSQTIYDPNCDECVHKSDTDAESLRRPPGTQGYQPTPNVIFGNQGGSDPRPMLLPPRYGPDQGRGYNSIPSESIDKHFQPGDTGQDGNSNVHPNSQNVIPVQSGGTLSPTGASFGPGGNTDGTSTIQRHPPGRTVMQPNDYGYTPSTVGISNNQNVIRPGQGSSIDRYRPETTPGVVSHGRLPDLNLRPGGSRWPENFGSNQGYPSDSRPNNTPQNIGSPGTPSYPINPNGVYDREYGNPQTQGIPNTPGNQGRPGSYSPDYRQGIGEPGKGGPNAPGTYLPGRFESYGPNETTAANSLVPGSAAGSNRYGQPNLPDGSKRQYDTTYIPNPYGPPPLMTHKGNSLESNAGYIPSGNIEFSPQYPPQINWPFMTGSYPGPNGEIYYCCVVSPNTHTDNANYFPNARNVGTHPGSNVPGTNFGNIDNQWSGPYGRKEDGSRPGQVVPGAQWSGPYGGRGDSNRAGENIPSTSWSGTYSGTDRNRPGENVHAGHWSGPYGRGGDDSRTGAHVPGSQWSGSVPFGSVGGGRDGVPGINGPYGSGTGNQPGRVDNTGMRLPGNQGFQTNPNTISGNQETSGPRPMPVPSNYGPDQGRGYNSIANGYVDKHFQPGDAGSNQDGNSNIYPNSHNTIPTQPGGTLTPGGGMGFRPGENLDSNASLQPYTPGLIDGRPVDGDYTQNMRPSQGTDVDNKYRPETLPGLPPSMDSHWQENLNPTQRYPSEGQQIYTPQGGGSNFGPTGADAGGGFRVPGTHGIFNMPSNQVGPVQYPPENRGPTASGNNVIRPYTTDNNAGANAGSNGNQWSAPYSGRGDGSHPRDVPGAQWSGQYGGRGDGSHSTGNIPSGQWSGPTQYGPVESSGNIPPYDSGNDNLPGRDIPQNVFDPTSLLGGKDDSAAEASIAQMSNGTVASATARGGNDKGHAQTNVQGTHTGSGSFSAQADITDENKGAHSAVEGGEKGSKSSAQGRGGNNLSQAAVQLGSETGSLQTTAESKGGLHSSSSQVQGSIKGGMADAQAKGPGSTSSQAQIGFTPHKEGDKSHDIMTSPFVGKGVASAQSSGRSGQSQSSLQGTFKYGISYNGAAQAGASLDKDAIFPNRQPFNSIDVFDENNKNINVNLKNQNTAFMDNNKLLDKTEITNNSEIKDHTHADHHKNDDANILHSTSSPVENRRSFDGQYKYSTEKEINTAEDYYPDSGFGLEGNEGTEVEQSEYSNYDEYNRDGSDMTHQSFQDPANKRLEVKQTTGNNAQHIILGSLDGQDAEITQRDTERPDESRIYQPGERVPGTGGYVIPIGFTGSVKSVASKNRTYAIGSKESPSQAQTVALSPGTGKVKYNYAPSRTAKVIKPDSLRSLSNTRNADNNRYVSVSKSVTHDLDSDNNIRKQYSHTYYTKSSSCGYFTFSCTMVSSPSGKKKICKPKLPTNPDGSPLKC